MNTVIVFNQSNTATALASNLYSGPMRFAPAPENFDANNWTNYIITANDVVIMRASTYQLEQSCQSHLDTFAQTKGYNDILSASSYANSSNSVYKLEGTYAADARDATWSKFYIILSEVQANTRPPIGCFADIVPELPELIWPD